MGIIMTLVIGGLAGFLAGKVLSGGGYGLLIDIILGLLGGWLGGWVFGMLGIQTGGIIGSLITAFIGACILVGITRLIKR